MFGKFDTHVDESLYLDIEENPATGEKHFTKYVRLKLTYYLLKAPIRKGGCDLEISKLLYAKKITTFFPLHDRYAAGKFM